MQPIILELSCFLVFENNIFFLLQDESSPEGSVTGGEGGGPVPTGSGRRGGVQNYSQGGVAPRFEKRPQVVF